MSYHSHHCTLRGVPPGRMLRYLMTRHSADAAPRDVYLCPYHASWVAEELRAMVTGAVNLADEVERLNVQAQEMIQLAVEAGADGVQDHGAGQANADQGIGGQVVNENGQPRFDGNGPGERYWE